MAAAKRKNKSSTASIEERWKSGEIDPCDLEPKFVDQLTPRELGEVGELLAITYIEEIGYSILEHHYRCPEGEADIIAFDENDDCVVLVEVKTRRSRGNGSGEMYPEEAVDRKKRRRYRRIAQCYLMDRYPVYSMRFDVVSVIIRCGCVGEVVHMRNAFDWEVE